MMKSLFKKRLSLLLALSIFATLLQYVYVGRFNFC